MWYRSNQADKLFKTVPVLLQNSEREREKIKIKLKLKGQCHEIFCFWFFS